MAERLFGSTITNSDGRVVPVRFIGEQHVMEDCGFIPTLADWLKTIQAEPWMRRVGKKLTMSSFESPASEPSQPYDPAPVEFVLTQ
jgi:hypothetical protein